MFTVFKRYFIINIYKWILRLTYFLNNVPINYLKIIVFIIIFLPLIGIKDIFNLYQDIYQPLCTRILLNDS